MTRRQFFYRKFSLSSIYAITDTLQTALCPLVLSENNTTWQIITVRRYPACHGHKWDIIHQLIATICKHVSIRLLVSLMTSLLYNYNSVALVCKKIIPTERRPLVGEVSSNYYYYYFYYYYQTDGVLGYRSVGPGSIAGTTRNKLVVLEWGTLSFVSTTEELLDRKVAAPV
jgi:hypothetical protein